MSQKHGIGVVKVPVAQVMYVDPDGSTVIYDVSGSSEAVCGPALTKIQQPHGVVTRETWDVLRQDRVLAFARPRQKSQLAATLLGTSSSAVVGFGSDVSRELSAITPPSWTQVAAGLNHSHASQPISASQYVSRALNAWSSGAVAVETTAVPYRQQFFYSKEQTLQKNIYYHLPSSAALGLNRSDFLGASASYTEVLGSTRPEYVLDGMYYSAFGISEAGTGSYFQVPIDVPDSGRLVDIKVWVEMFFSGTTTGSFEWGDKADVGSLGNIAIALRSPTVKGFGNGHPIRNDSNYPTKKVSLRDAWLTDSFILWEGAGVYAPSLQAIRNDVNIGLPGFADRPEWMRDFAMRTVFWDSAPQQNPRHLGRIRSGELAGVGDLTASAPNAVAFGNGVVFGNNTSWYNTSSSNGVPQSGSPPSGWLTGPGGTPAAGEWNTSGTQRGPTHLQPLYPLLDSVFCQKLDPLSGYQTQLGTFNQYGTAQPRWRGYRPGLRGTEISGRWHLVIFVGLNVMAVRFRNVRLEITYDKNRPPIRQTTRDRAGRRPGPAGFKPHIWNYISGSGFTRVSVSVGLEDIDSYPTAIWITDQPASRVNRTVGITDNTASTDYAVFTRPVGVLQGDDEAHARLSYLRNEFGTPYIPLSSGSASSSEFLTELSSSATQVYEYFNPKPSVGGKRTLSEVVRAGRRSSSLG